MNDLLRKFLFGTSLPQEYISLRSEEIHQPFQVYLSTKKQKRLLNVSDNHVFLGYKPLIISLSFDRNTDAANLLNEQDEVCISLSIQAGANADYFFEGFPVHKESAAFLILTKVRSEDLGKTRVFFFNGIRGTHKFLSPLHIFNYNLKKKFSSARKGNIGLDGNLQQQVEIAYAVPRVISMITVTDGEKMNMFPTDLHGPLDENYYVSSLRIGGKASEQVDRRKKIAVTDVDSSFHNEAYALGKNHMQDPDCPERFELTGAKSTQGIYIPTSGLSFHDLSVDRSFEFGIHRIYMYKILSSEKIRPGQRLTHMHRAALQWRINHNLHADLLFR